MENHDSLRPDPPGPDPLRDGANADRAAGLVAYHQLQRMWEESQEDQSRFEETTGSTCEPPVSIPLPVGSPRAGSKTRFIQYALWVVGGILLLLLLILLF